MSDELRRQVAKANSFRKEVGWLDTGEACALLADVLENPEPPPYLSSLYVDVFLSWGPTPIPFTRKCRIRDLSEHERKRLITSLRSRCKPVEYASEAA